MQQSLVDNVVLVTGSARRVGKAIALSFAKAGADLVIHHHASPNEAEQTVQEIRELGRQAMTVQADQSKPDDVARLFDEIQAHYGRLDVLVNSAGSFTQTPLLNLTYQEWQRVLDTNLTGPLLCLQHAARMMQTGGGGVIINIADNSAFNIWKTRPAHTISKASVVMLTKVAARALGPDNIRVSCVVPGPVLQPPDESDENWERIAQNLPLQRDGAPVDVGQACVFLAENDFISGAILHVDGGEHLT